MQCVFYCLFALVYLSPLSIVCVLLFSVCCAASLCEINCIYMSGVGNAAKRVENCVSGNVAVSGFKHVTGAAAEAEGQRAGMERSAGAILEKGFSEE